MRLRYKTKAFDRREIEKLDEWLSRMQPEQVIISHWGVWGMTATIGYKLKESTAMSKKKD